MQPNRTLSLKQKLLLTGVLLAVAPLLALGLVFWRQFDTVSTAAKGGAERLAGSYLSQAGESLYSAASAEQDDVLSSLRVAHASLDSSGGFQIVRHRHTTWDATNQETHEQKKITLPLVAIGRKPGRGSKAQSRKILVDEVRDLTGATCTVFQRMNPEGDMLRVSTNILTADGKRAIGTYLPAVSASGKPNAVLAAVLAGKVYTGKATVVGTPFITAYEPVNGADGSIVGMLYAGITEQGEAEKLKRNMSGMQSAERGEIFAVSTAAANRGQYLFSARKGQATLPEGDARKKLIDAAMENANQPSVQHYQSPRGVPMVAHLRYFDSWKWLLGVAIPEQEYLETPRQIEQIARHGRDWVGGVFLISLFASILIWTRAASVLATQLAGFARRTQENGLRIRSWAKRLNSSSQEHGGDIAEQIAAVERSSTRIQGVARDNEERAQQALKASGVAHQQAEETQQQLAGMQSSMQQLSTVNTKISGLMKTIDEIAFQSRILALNARIEAARAGDAGVSFAVVADQFGSLAERCADAANSTTEFLTESSNSTREGMDKLRDLGSAIQKMAESSGEIQTTIAGVHTATGQQVQASGEISQSLSVIKNVLAQNSKMAAQSTEASNELQVLAGELNAHTEELSRVVEGGKRKPAPQPQLVKSKPQPPKTSSRQQPRPVPVQARRTANTKLQMNSRAAGRAS